MKLTKTELKQIIREEIQKLNESTYKHGFDLTDISPRNWKTLLKMFNIPTKPKLDKNMWVWKSTEHDVFIVTGNDPISGEYATKGGRRNEVGYASYIGIEGDEEVVKEIVDYIKNNADYIKGQSVGKRLFI